MGILSGPEENEREYRIKKIKEKIDKVGIHDFIPERRYEQLIVLQNQAIIELLTLTASDSLAATEGGSIGLDRYYSSLAILSNMNLDD